jgi:hypothetical protein
MQPGSAVESAIPGYYPMPKDTAIEAPKLFSHPGKPVFVLVPVNERDADSCKQALADAYFSFMETPPEVVTEIKPMLLRQDSIIYVSHPTRVRKPNKAGRYEFLTEPHISAPFEMESLVQGKSRVQLDLNTITGELSKRCKNDQNDRGGRFFRAQLSSIDKKAPNDAMIRITDL